MSSPTWEGVKVLGNAAWIPVEPSSADSARLVTDRWPHLTLIATAPVRDAWDRPGHVLIAHDRQAARADHRFLAVAMSTNPREHLFAMSHHQAPTLGQARAWLREQYHGDTPLELSTEIMRTAREAASRGSTLTTRALPTPATTEPAASTSTPPRALGR